MAKKRDMEVAWWHIEHLIRVFTEDECANYFRNVGYNQN